jgi:YVTN family beta-propeller protein
MNINGFAGEMLWDGSHLWVANMRNNTLLKIDPEQALVIDSIPVEGGIEAIAWDSSNLWFKVGHGLYRLPHIIHLCDQFAWHPCYKLEN